MIGLVARGLAALVSWALLVAAALVAAAWFAGTDEGPLPFVVLATPYAAVLAVAGALLALVTRARLRVLLGVVLTGVLLWTQAPLAVADGPVASGPRITVLTANLEFGGADLDQLLDTVARERVDLLFVQELTPAAEAQLSAGLRGQLPHRYAASAPRAAGTGLWSRAPLRGTRTLTGFRMRNLVAQTELGGTRVTVAAVHPAAPLPWRTGTWRAEHAALRDELARLRGPVLVAGDFNATRDHAVMRALAQDGFVSAADSAGAGLVRTWPLSWRGGRPVIGVDHVLVRGAWRAVRVRSVEVPGTDHAAVLAELRPPA